MASASDFDLEAELALAPRADWRRLVDQAIAGLDLPGALDLLALRWSTWERTKYDLLSEASLLNTPLLRSLSRWHGLRTISSLRPRGQSNLVEQTGIGPHRVLALGQEGGLFDSGSVSSLFIESADASLRRSGVPSRLSALIASAMIEMSVNALEHSESRHRPILSFVNGVQGWAFSVTDLGIGLRRSLASCAHYHNVSEQEAMRLCLQDGISRWPDRGRGTGFTTLFQALAESNVAIRLRSGTIGAYWQGEAPTAQLLTYQLLMPRHGFHIAARFERRTAHA